MSRSSPLPGTRIPAGPGPAAGPGCDDTTGNDTQRARGWEGGGPVRSLSLLVLLAAAPVGAQIAFAETYLSAGALPLEADPGDGTLVTVVELRYSYRTEGVATGPTEIVLHVAEEPAGVEAALVPDRLQVPVPIEPSASTARHAPPQHAALLVRFVGETAAPAHVTVLAHAHANGNLKSSTATLRLPLALPAAPETPVAAPQPEAAAQEPAPQAVPAGALTTGAFAGAAAGLFALALRLRRAPR